MQKKFLFLINSGLLHTTPTSQVHSSNPLSMQRIAAPLQHNPPMQKPQTPNAFTENMNLFRKQIQDDLQKKMIVFYQQLLKGTDQQTKLLTLLEDFMVTEHVLEKNPEYYDYKVLNQITKKFLQQTFHGISLSHTIYPILKQIMITIIHKKYPHLSDKIFNNLTLCDLLEQYKNPNTSFNNTNETPDIVLDVHKCLHDKKHKHLIQKILCKALNITLQGTQFPAISHYIPILKMNTLERLAVLENISSPKNDVVISNFEKENQNHWQELQEIGGTEYVEKYLKIFTPDYQNQDIWRVPALCEKAKMQKQYRKKAPKYTSAEDRLIKKCSKKLKKKHKQQNPDNQTQCGENVI